MASTSKATKEGRIAENPKGTLETYHTLAKQYYRQGYSKEEAFELICKEFEYKQPKPNEIEELFRQYVEDLIFHEYKEVNGNVYNVVEAVTKEYQKLHHVIGSWNYGRLSFLDSRYTFGIKKNEDNQASAIVMHDNFYGQKREIALDRRIKKGSYRVEAIDMEFCLLFVQNVALIFATNYPRWTIYLIKLDIANNKCTVLDDREYQGFPLHFCKDTANPRKFIIMVYYGSIRMHFGEIDGLALRIKNERYVFDGFEDFGGLKLTDDSMYAFGPDRINGHAHSPGHNIEFNELIVLDGNNIGWKNIFEADKVDRIVYRAINGADIKYAWSGSICYFAERVCTNEYNIISYDTDKRHYFSIGRSILDNIIQMCASDGILTVLCEKDETKTHVYRFPLNKPDKLENLSLFKIRQQSIFYGRQILENIKLPVSLRPFSFLPPNKSIQLTKKPERKSKRMANEVPSNRPRTRSQTCQTANVSETPSNKRSKKT